MALKDDIDKLRFIDSLFHAFTLEEMTELAGPDLVVAKLRGIDKNHIGPIGELYETMIRLRDDNTMLKTQMVELKSDIQDIVRILNSPPVAPVPLYNQYLNSLKSKHNIY